MSNALVLAAIGACLATGFILSPATGDGAVALELFGLTLPTICWFRLTTGIPCVGCGLTRSVVLLMHGQLGTSVAVHPFGIVAVGLALLQFPPRLVRALGRGGRWIVLWDRGWSMAAAAALGLMLVWWIHRVGLPALYRTLWS